MSSAPAPENQPTVGFIGLGNMGAPMSALLIKAGYQVLGFDVSDAACDAHAHRGGNVAASPAEIAQQAAIVILMLPDSGVVDAIVTDPAFLAALRPGSLIVDMSSSEPARTRALAAVVAGHHADLIDAPVSGGVPRAVTGKLAVMVGGDDAQVSLAAPVLELLGTIYRAGAVGAGHAVKALNNLMSATHLLITSEAMVIGEEFDISPEMMLPIFNASSGKSGSTENKWPNFILPERYDSGFSARLMLKDMRIALGLAEHVQVPSRLAALATSMWGEAADALPADADHTEIARWFRQVATPAQLGDGPRLAAADEPGEAVPARSRPGQAPPAQAGSGETTATVTARLTQRQEQLKAEFIEVRGVWSDAWETVLRLDAEFLEGYLHFSAVPWRHGSLPPKVKEFIYIAIDASATHMYLPGVRQHIRAALSLGATGAEIMEVLELTATLGIHAMNVGMPVLVEVLSEAGKQPDRVLDARRYEIRTQFARLRGYWHASWDDILQLDPELLAAYLEFSAVPWRSGSLEPKVKEFIYIAFDAAATHLYRPGLKIHMENALRYGATAEEIIEVMEIASVLGVHAVTTAAPILAEELASGESDRD